VTAAFVVTDAPLAHLRWDAGAEAPCAVLLHGVGGSRESFGDTISGTGAALLCAGISVVAVDLPGYGDSRPVEPMTMATMAEALERLLRTLPDRRLALVGHSMGGMVAQEFMAEAALAQRERIASLVLIGTTAAFGRAGGVWQREFLAQRLASLDAGGGMMKLAPGLTTGMASPRAPHDAVARAALLMSAVPEATYRAALGAIVGFDRREALVNLRVPVLCLAGADDRNAPPAVMEQMAQRIPLAEYRCLPAVGHLSHMEAPEAVNAVLIDFLCRTL
jgi:pimeloyl-ACP methyl ester carboxylesterase